MTSLIQLNINKLKVVIYETRSQMGAAAGNDVAQKISELLIDQTYVNIIFAAAPSQNELLSSLVGNNDIDWSRVNAFHMDEYIGLPENSNQSFGFFLNQNIFNKVPFNSVHYINGNAKNLNDECLRYSELLESHPVDIVCMGIGENTHIAFNDPHTADFNDPALVKVVTLDEVSRMQQVHDKCFEDINEVPAYAITLTIPALLKAKSIHCVVPGSNKATAIYNTIKNDINVKYPSTVLKNHSNATLYLDKDSAVKL